MVFKKDLKKKKKYKIHTIRKDIKNLKFDLKKLILMSYMGHRNTVILLSQAGAARCNILCFQYCFQCFFFVLFFVVVIVSE